MRAARVLALALVSTLAACEGCPLAPPADAGPACTRDDDCAGGEVCRGGACVLAPVDAGPPPFDAGPPPFDAGPLPVDAGPLPVDAGPPPVDAGPPPVDAGPPPVDAGPLPDVRCASTRDCDAARGCAELRDEGTEVVPYCAAPSGAPGALGDACDDGGDCDSTLCVPRAEVCSEACADAALDCAPDMACTAYPFGATSGFTFLGVCVPACAADDDCAAGRVCTYNGDPLKNEFDAICEVPEGPGLVGASCTNTSDCESGLCLAAGCSRVCTVSADCQARAAPGNTLTTCDDVTVADPNDTGATRTLRMCVE